MHRGHDYKQVRVHFPKEMTTPVTFAQMIHQQYDNKSIFK